MMDEALYTKMHEGMNFSLYPIMYMSNIQAMQCNVLVEDLLDQNHMCGALCSCVLIIFGLWRLSRKTFGKRNVVLMLV